MRSNGRGFPVGSSRTTAVHCGNAVQMSEPHPHMGTIDLQGCRMSGTAPIWQGGTL